MAYAAREFKKTITINYQQAKDIRNAQTDMYEYGFVAPNAGLLTQRLSLLASVLGFFVSTTAAALALGVVSVVSGSTTPPAAALKNMVYEGFYRFNSVIRTFEDNPSYRLIEIELPFIEFSQGGEVKAAFITGAGRPIRIQTGSGWILL